MSAGAELKELESAIDSYIDKHWEELVEDIATLVRIPSTDDVAHARPDAPFGPAPKQALDVALKMANRLGFPTTEVDGYVGFADLVGASPVQIGMIGHVDVVPAGIGWTHEPFDVARIQGYLIGRGVLDDKGPSVVALHAMKILKEFKSQWPYTLRMIFGSNEEVGMSDVAYYRSHYADPAFLFTPDACFPVCYGEKGGYNGVFCSGALSKGCIVELAGGVARNAVPSVASALVDAPFEILGPAEYVSLTQEGPYVRIEAQGRSGHASKPQGTHNAIARLLEYLLAYDLCNDQERAYFEMLVPVLNDYTGKVLGIDVADEHFGPLTIIGGMIEFDGHCYRQHIDVRYPTSINKEELESALSAYARRASAQFKCTMTMKPFLVDPKSPMIQSLLESYREVTGDASPAFTMGGGTYARHFSCAASFGPVLPYEQTPDWVGPEHGPDEGVSEECLKQALKIYVLTLYKLMQLDLS